MKESRSMTSRNVVGGFLGGVLGILAFGYLHAWLLPVGCLMGVLMGYWYELVGEMCNSYYDDTFEIAKSTWKYCTVPKHQRQSHWLQTDHVRGLVMLVIFWLLTRVRWINRLCVSKRTVRWKRLRFLAALTFIALNSLWFVPAWKWLQHPNGEPSPFYLGLVFCIGLFVGFPVLSLMDSIRREKAEMSYAFYCDYNIFFSFLREIVGLLRIEGGVLLLTASHFLWFLGVGALFVATVILPVTLAVGIVKGIYALVTRRGHWLCVGVTLVMTTIVAWKAAPLLPNATVLWVAALTAGTCSGLVAEAARRLIAAIFALPVLQDVAEKSLGTRLLALFDGFGRLGMKMPFANLHPYD